MSDPIEESTYFQRKYYQEKANEMSQDLSQCVICGKWIRKNECVVGMYIPHAKKERRIFYKLCSRAGGFPKIHKGFSEDSQLNKIENILEELVALDKVERLSTGGEVYRA